MEPQGKERPGFSRIIGCSAPMQRVAMAITKVAPSDATVLLGGTDLNSWQLDNGKPAPWHLINGYMEVEPKSGSIRTKEEFGDCQLHLEFATPIKVEGKSQGRGNSGVLIHGWGEVQVLDSYENDTYPDGQAAAIYNRYPPLVNA